MALNRTVFPFTASSGISPGSSIIVPIEPVLPKDKRMTSTPETDLISEELFGQNAVKKITKEDFNLDTETPITLKWDNCILILFYSDNDVSRGLTSIWNEAAMSVVGPIFAASNLIEEEKVGRAFADIKKKNTPYQKFGLKTIPFILTYQLGEPIGFYNGELSVSAIIDYALTMACNPD